MAMKKPVIVGDNPANRELFQDRVNGLICEMGSPEALAHSILEAKNDATLRQRIADGSYETFKDRASPSVIAAEIGQLIDLVGAMR
jgi:glycosyltransferase involved in cell wall biosynthesis